MEEAQIKQIIKRQPLHGSALLDPRCKILLLVCIGFVSYFLAGEVVSLALMLVYGLFIALGNGEKWAAKMIVTYIVVAYLNALLRYVQVPVLSVIMSVFGVTVLKLIPIMMMGFWILRTTYMDDLMVALQRVRLPQAVTIPLGLPRGPVRIHATIFSLWTSSPQEISRRSFIQNNSFTIELAGDLPEIIRTLLLVLFIKGATICCAQGQIIYVDKRGANPPRCNQT